MENIWNKVQDKLPEEGLFILGYRKEWIDDTYNPEGTRECFLRDNSWISVWWNPDMDQWDTVELMFIEGPTHWIYIKRPNVE